MGRELRSFPYGAARGAPVRMRGVIALCTRGGAKHQGMTEPHAASIRRSERYSPFFVLAIVATAAFLVFMGGVLWLAFSR